MSANWNNPTTASAYTDVISEFKSRDVDAASLAESPTNPPTNYKRWNVSASKLQNWNGASWDDLVLSIAGGGTGGTTAGAARTALGLGTMAVQNSNSVSITGGSISGITVDAGAVTTGTLALARGGTNASLSLGTAGQVLGSNGSAVAFLDGTSITVLNGSNISTGTVPNARLPTTITQNRFALSTSAESITAYSVQLVSTTVMFWMGAGGFVFKYNSTGSGGDRFTIDNAGNVTAIGSVTGAALSISGNATVTGTVAGGSITAGSPTGGAIANAVNAQAIYINGVAVSTSSTVAFHDDTDVDFFGTVYNAGAGGCIVEASAYAVSDGDGFIIFAEAANPPTTQRAYVTHKSGEACSATIAVPANWYFKIQQIGTINTPYAKSTVLS